MQPAGMRLHILKSAGDNEIRKEPTMPTFIALSQFTEKGVAAIKDTAKRAEGFVGNHADA